MKDEKKDNSLKTESTGYTLYIIKENGVSADAALAELCGDGGSE